MEWIYGSLLILTLLLQFRLLDDLCDRNQDRIDHPERVLVRAQSLTPFQTLLLALILGNLVAISIWREAPRPAVLLALNVFSCLWYPFGRRLMPGAIVHYHVILIKYPTFAYLGGSSPSWPVLVLLYLACCVYEVVHDRRLQRLAGSRLLIALETTAFALVLAYCVLGAPS